MQKKIIEIIDRLLFVIAVLVSIACLIASVTIIYDFSTKKSFKDITKSLDFKYHPIYNIQTRLPEKLTTDEIMLALKSGTHNFLRTAKVYASYKYDNFELYNYEQIPELIKSEYRILSLEDLKDMIAIQQEDYYSNLKSGIYYLFAAALVFLFIYFIRTLVLWILGISTLATGPWMIFHTFLMSFLKKFNQKFSHD